MHVETDVSARRFGPCARALIQHLGSDWVVKAIHGTAFPPPNAFERFYDVP